MGECVKFTYYGREYEEKEKRICPSVSDFIRHLANKAGTGNGIGQSTVNKIRNFAVEEGFMN